MSNEWPSVTALPELGPGEVQIWRIDLNGAAPKPDIYMKSLSSVEVERAGRLRAGQVRMQFVVARACLRALLGHLMDLRPSDVPIALGPQGKPEVIPADGSSLFFNVAHSRETILIALCGESRVGIDIEYLDRETDVLEIARNSFTPDEFHRIEEAGGPADLRRAFFRCWTRKEAVIKADGRGLSIPLSDVEVPVSEGAASAPVRIAGSSLAGSETWFVTDLELGDGIAGALATDRSELRPSTFSLPLNQLR
jgi:4'-phosphopantetheinyl transferase